MSGLLQQLNGEMAGVVEKVRCNLVQISSGRGAGTIWHPEGLIITKPLIQGYNSSYS